jgi:murein DD-endopeptidase MepM/ murein hydrolase activator NlpD
MVQGAVATPRPQSPGPVAVRADPTPAGSALLAAPVAPDASVPIGPALPESLEGYRWPLPKGRLTLPFGPSPWGSRLVDGAAFHDGLDLATFCGDRIVAAHDGTVLAAGRRYDRYMGWDGDLGPYLRRLERKKLWSTLPIVVIVDDGNGYRSVYAHFGKVTVKKGQSVAAGDLIGYEGATGRASGCHLHYGMFSPLETARFEIEPDVAKRMKLPASQVARIDPLRVLPPRTKDPEPYGATPPDSSDPAGPR